MKDSRKSPRRAASRAFRPGLDGRLEERVLLTPRVKLIDVATRFAQAHQAPRGLQRQSAAVPGLRRSAVFNRQTGFAKIKAIGVQTARGGQNVEVTATDGSHYMITLSYTSNTLATSTAEGANGQAGASTAAAHPAWSPCRTPDTRSQSARFAPIRCLAAAWASSSTARPRTPSSRSTRSD